MAGNTGVTATCQHPIINTHLHPDMVRLHLTRALLAAAITLCMTPAVVITITTVEHLARWGSLISLEFKYLAEDMQEIAACFAMLLLMVAVPMLALWLLPSARRSLQRPWVAAIAGMMCGVLLTWPWMASFPIISPGHSELTWDSFIDDIPTLMPMAAITAGLYGYLHSFFIRQALGKKAWLGTRA